MAKTSKEKGAGIGCLYLIGILLLIGIAIVVLGYAVCIAIGVGLWFGIRFCWRLLMQKYPESALVKKGLAIPPLMRNVLAAIPCIILSVVLICGFSVWLGSNKDSSGGGSSSSTTAVEQPSSTEKAQTDEQPKNTEQKADNKTTADAPKAETSFSYDQVPAYSGSASVQMNGNVPYFSSAEVQYAKDNPGFEIYGDQDKLGRCSAAWASVGTETMPAEGEERGEIGQIKPSGWQTVKYDSVPGKYLYNRCHLLGWQLTDENANVKNLITGTRAMNTDGMLKYEDDVASYVKRTGNHVLYRVTPVFLDDELLARGVLMEARSVEDDGKGLSFCVWAYNVQAGITINYADGSSSETPLLPAAEESPADEAAVEEAAPAAEEPAEEEAVEEAAPATEEKTHTYILNTNTGKFHLPGCNQIKKMKEANKSEVESTRSDMIANGYSPCAKCNP